MAAPDEIGKPLESADKADHDASNSADHVGQGDRDVRKGYSDLNDGDQDSRDKARNTSEDGADALRQGHSALDALGIKDPGLDKLADSIDHFTDDAFGPRPPELLPPVVYRVFFGAKKGGLLKGLEGDLLHDGASALEGLGKSVLGSVPGVGGMLGGMADHALTSMMDKPQKETEDPVWAVVRVRLEEGLSEPFRCELVLARKEVRSDQERALRDSPVGGGGVVGQVKSAFGSVMGAVSAAEHAVGDALGSAKSLLSDPLGAAKGLLGGGSDPNPELDHVKSPADDPVYINIPVDPAKFLNQAVSFSISRELTDDATKAKDPARYKYPYVSRWATGVVTEFEDMGQRYNDPDDKNVTPEGMRFVRVVIRPSLWKLTLKKNCRIFQNLNAIQIVRAVFRETGVYGPKVPALTSVPGVGDALGAVQGFVSGLASHVPLVGGALADALDAQLIKTVPPKGKSEQDWTPTREYCVQYNETDLDFVHRLLEEEGITYYVLHGKRSERLVLLDDPSALDKCGTIDGRAAPFIRSDGNDLPPVETVWELAQRRTLQPTRVTLRDWNFSDQPPAPTKLPFGDTAAQPPGTLEVYEYPARAVFRYEDDKVHYKRYTGDEKQGDRDLPKLRLQAYQTEEETGTGSANLVAVAPGTALLVHGHRSHHEKDHGQTAKLLVRRVVVTGYTQATAPGPAVTADHMLRLASRPFAAKLKASADAYLIHFEYVWVDPTKPTAPAFRPPRRTPRPVIRGLQTATVVDDSLHPLGIEQADEQIHMDQPTLGRVKVHFHWDERGEGDPLAKLGRSCWLRVAQPWAGDNWGVVFTPRVGMEVVVSFLDGDPDRPMILGCVYNGAHEPPVDHLAAKEQARSMIRTRTNPGRDPTWNELVFDDTGGKEEVRVRAQKYLIEEVRNDHGTEVGHDQTNDVDAYHGEIVDGRQSLTVGGKRTKTVTLDETTTIDRHRDETVAGQETVTVHGTRAETVGGMAALSSGDPSAGTRDVKRSLTVYGNRVTEVHPPPEPAPDRMPDHPSLDALEVKGDKTDTIALEYTVLARTFSVGQKGGGQDPTGVGLTRDALRVDSKQDLTLDAKGFVRVVSDHNDVDIEGDEAVDMQCNGNSLHMAAGDEFSIALRASPTSTLTLQVGAADNKTAVIMTKDDAWLVVQGNPAAQVHLKAGEIDLDGGSLGVLMENKIGFNVPTISFNLDKERAAAQYLKKIEEALKALAGDLPWK